MIFQKIGKTIGNDLESLSTIILPRVIGWIQELSHRVMAEGISLNEQQKLVAASVGVTEVDRIKIFFFDSIQYPDDNLLKEAILENNFLGPDMIGLTVGHGILIKKNQLTNRLLSHECRHVHQYERYGSIDNFLSEYVKQIVNYGYLYSPLEVEARSYETSQ